MMESPWQKVDYGNGKLMHWLEASCWSKEHFTPSNFHSITFHGNILHHLSKYVGWLMHLHHYQEKVCSKKCKNLAKNVMPVGGLAVEIRFARSDQLINKNSNFHQYLHCGPSEFYNAPLSIVWLGSKIISCQLLIKYYLSDDTWLLFNPWTHEEHVTDPLPNWYCQRDWLVNRKESKE